MATVDVTISCIIKVGRIQFFGTVKTCQTRFMVQIAFGHYFFCFIHYSMAFWACFKTSLWTFDSCCFQRWGIIRPVFKVLNIFNIARFAVDFLLKEIRNLMKLFLLSKILLLMLYPPWNQHSCCNPSICCKFCRWNTICGSNQNLMPFSLPKIKYNSY